MSRLSDKTIEKIQGAIISSYETLFYLEEVKKVAPHTFKHRAKLNLKRTLEDLQEIERTYFDEVDKIDDNDMSNKIVSNKLTYTDWLLNKFSFNDYLKFQQISYAFEIDPARITGISDKILKENNG